MNMKMVPMIILLILGISAGVGLATVFWKTDLSASVTVTDNPYKATLYEDADCLIPMTNLDFGELMETQDGVATSEWVEVHLQLEEVPSEIVYVHITTTGTLPDGAVIEGQKWRYLTGVWADVDVGNHDCDGSLGSTSPLINGKPTEVFHFKITMPTDEAGTYDGFGMEFTMTDSTTN